MSMLDVLEKEINNLNLFDGNIPEIVTTIANSIPSQSIPYRMKMALAISEIMLFTSQFKMNIKHWNDSIIPINSIMFCVAKSGASKDSSLKAARKCFAEGYNLIHEHRQNEAVKRAIELATEAGCDVPDKFASYKDYYTAPNPLFVAISTTEGFIQHLNDLANETLGAGYIFSGEIGAELANSMNLVENIKVLSELYDEGSKEVKVIKNRDTQSKEVTNLPVSALFIGSQDNILYDDAIKRKFKTEFTTKLARRSFFIFANEEAINTDSFADIKEMLKKERTIEDKATVNREKASNYINNVAEELLENAGETIDIASEVRDLFILYKKYNEAMAQTIDNQFPITKLTRTHLQWKALKLSGAIALLDLSPTIEINHYRAAIEFVELISNDVTVFEKELVKESYELFTDYVRLYANNGEYTITLHNLRKLGFISMKGQSDTHLKELVKLANSYDEKGIYTLKKDTVEFKKVEETDNILLSYLECSGTKVQRRSKCNEGFQCEEITFKDLERMLEGDYAYSPFKFLNGVRGRDNIDSGCKWLVLDIDTSEITDEEAHLLLSDINHFVVRTSDKNNPNKFRVLLELDAEVSIPDIQWKAFITSIVNDLGLVADALPKSQIFFSYKDRDILSVLDESPLSVKPHLNNIASIDTTPKTLSKKTASNLLADPLTTFEKAFNARDGEGRRKLIWAARRARELGASKEYTIDLLNQINNYWVKPLPDPDFSVGIINQVNRWSFD